MRTAVSEFLLDSENSSFRTSSNLLSRRSGVFRFSNKKQQRYVSLLFSTGFTTLFIFFTNSLLGIITLCPQPSHFIRMSMPSLMIFQRFVPHGCGFFISTISFNSNVFSMSSPLAYLFMFLVCHCFFLFSARVHNEPWEWYFNSIFIETQFYFFANHPGDVPVVHRCCFCCDS